jgi:hypothetical protein
MFYVSQIFAGLARLSNFQRRPSPGQKIGGAPIGTPIVRRNSSRSIVSFCRRSNDAAGIPAKASGHL